MKAKTLVLSLTLVFAGYGQIACNRGDRVEAAEENQPPAVDTAEQDFMTKLMQAYLAELDMAGTALQKSSNNDVRDYANMIRSDDSSALDDLADLMKAKNVPAPRTLTGEAQKDIMRMNRLTGPDFDREFINLMVTDHQWAVEVFRDMQTGAQNPDVRKYVEDRLPNLEMHLDKGQQLQSKLFNARGEPPRLD